MERQFPKNVRQVGNVCDEPKIYLEDYVDTYLSQIRMKAVDAPIAAALAGEITEHDGQPVVYISGAMQIKDIEVNGTDVLIKDDAKEDMEEVRKRYFPSQDIVGWCLIETGHPMSLHQGVNKLHGKMFAKENSIYIWKDSVENDEMFYAYKYGELMQMGGHYIYYEKNPAMQNYMINTRRQNGVTPSEMVEDRAAKDFRSAIREKSGYREQRQSSRILYVTSVFLVIIVLVIGVSAMSSYDKMESVQNSLESLSRSVSRPAEGETLAQDKVENDTAALAGPGNVKEGIKEESDNTDGTGSADITGNADAMDSTNSAGGVSSVGGTDGAGGTEDAGNAENTEASADNMPEAFATLEQLGEADFYIVKKGDTLDTISIDVYGDRDHVDAICKMNGLSDGNLIYIGQKLLLP